MKEYITKTLNKLNQLTTKHPDTDLRFGNHLLILEHCKIHESDIKYDELTNTIYIGY